MTRLKNKNRKSKRHEIAHEKLLIRTMKTLYNAVKLMNTQHEIIEVKDKYIKTLRRTIFIEMGIVFALGISNIFLTLQAPIMTFLTKLFLIF